MIFVFPGEPEWNEAERAVEFAVELGEYAGKVYATQALLQMLVGHRPRPEEAVALFHANRTALERLAEARIRDRALDPDANIRLVPRDLRRLSSRHPPEA